MYQDHANSSKNDLRQIEPLGVDIPVKMMNKEYLNLFDIQYNKLGDRICKATARDWVALEDECVKGMTAYYQRSKGENDLVRSTVNHAYSVSRLTQLLAGRGIPDRWEDECEQDEAMSTFLVKSDFYIFRSEQSQYRNLEPDEIAVLVLEWQDWMNDTLQPMIKKYNQIGQFIAWIVNLEYIDESIPQFKELKLELLSMITNQLFLKSDLRRGRSIWE